MVGYGVIKNILILSYVKILEKLCYQLAPGNCIITNHNPHQAFSLLLSLIHKRAAPLICVLSATYTKPRYNSLPLQLIPLGLRPQRAWMSGRSSTITATNYLYYRGGIL